MMAKDDRISSLAFLGFSLLVCLESIRLGTGSFSQPGPGMVPLGGGLALGVMSLAVWVQTWKRAGRIEEETAARRGHSGKIVSVLASLGAYALLIEHLGFALVTFFWMSFVCWQIGEMGWKRVLGMAVLATLSSYILFEYALQIRFPRGIWGEWFGFHFPF